MRTMDTIYSNTDQYVICSKCGAINMISNDGCCNCGVDLVLPTNKIEQDESDKKIEKFIEESVKFYMKEYPCYTEDDVMKMEITVR